MNVSQELLNLIEQMPDEQLSVLMNVALMLKENNSDDISNLKTLQFESQADREWVSAENDIYDEIFAEAVL